MTIAMLASQTPRAVLSGMRRHCMRPAYSRHAVASTACIYVTIGYNGVVAIHPEPAKQSSSAIASPAIAHAAPRLLSCAAPADCQGHCPGDCLDAFRQPLPAEAINALPLTRFEGQVFVFPDMGDLDAAIEDILAEPVIGFDTERRPAFRKGQNYPLSLLQLGTANAVYLFQLCRMTLPDVIRHVLSDPNTCKTGVAVRDDVRELRTVVEFQAAGFVDLGEVARANKLPTCGLRNLAANFLGIRISKKERCSNWGRSDLTPQQIAYAATDAWVSREIHLRMQQANLL